MNTTAELHLHRNCSTAAKVAEHLRACADTFVPPLWQRVDIDTYAAKIVTHAERFEAWANDQLVGLVAAYCNAAQTHAAFITNVSVADAWKGNGIASRLLQMCIDHVQQARFECLELDVDLHNAKALSLYEKYGFAAIRTRERTLTLQLAVERKPR